ncbi:MAG: hypothetical protein L6Q72_13790 [Burkholderiaceae bacterium]|nr:hypothetical protein [Burkholderiaceae bacterium]
MAERITVQEGVHSAEAVVALAERLGVDMPIVRAVDRVLNHRADLDQVIADLLALPFGVETAVVPVLRRGGSGRRTGIDPRAASATVATNDDCSQDPNSERRGAVSRRRANRPLASPRPQAGDVSWPTGTSNASTAIAVSSPARPAP